MYSVQRHMPVVYLYHTPQIYWLSDIYNVSAEEFNNSAPSGEQSKQHV